MFSSYTFIAADHLSARGPFIACLKVLGDLEGLAVARFTQRLREVRILFGLMEEEISDGAATETGW
jgi:hypothetical protein